VLDSIRRIVHSLRISAGAGQHGGISAAQLFILEKLAEADGPLSVNELAERTLTHQSSVSVVVQKLERQKLIHRATSRQDARRLELELAPKARTLLRKAAPAPQHRIIEAVVELPAAKRKQLADLLERVASKVAGKAEPAMLFEDHHRRRHGRA
jgi:DNA-binding MarR family transcriptional regulator